MTYNYQELEELIHNFKEGAAPTAAEQDVLIAIHSIGRDGASANGNIMYNLSSSEYNQIQLEIYSNQSLNDEEKQKTSKETLLKYVRSIDDIISEIVKDKVTLEYKKQLFESPKFTQYLFKGLKILEDII